jgi:phosphatidylserine/phosphatidylglycerophosphate/cardiolipin synthase-like enzyme
MRRGSILSRILYKRFCLLLVAACIVACTSSQADNSVALNQAPVRVYFSPDGGCTDAIVNAIDNARSNIFVQAYSFTSAPISKALLNAHKRGIQVEVILDKSQKSERYTSATFLAHGGISTFIDSRHAIAHNKIMIIDRETVIT